MFAFEWHHCERYILHDHYLNFQGQHFLSRKQWAHTKCEIFHYGVHRIFDICNLIFANLVFWLKIQICLQLYSIHRHIAIVFEYNPIDFFCNNFKQMERANELFLNIHDAFKKIHSRKLNIKINNRYYPDKNIHASHFW